MNKTLLTSLSVIALTSIASASSLQDVANSTYKLFNQSAFSCSAVTISPNQLLTAAHCIPRYLDGRTGLAIWIEQYDRTQLLHREVITVKVLRANYDDDTAILEVRGDRKFDNWVDIADKFEPVIGDQLFAVGYPRGDELTLTEGMFTTTTNLEQQLNVKGDYWKVTVPITGGSSGGGFYTRTLINDEWNYELIGLATATYRDVSFQSYISTTNALHKVVSGLVTLDDESVKNLMNAEK